jgi:tight adherence protein B
VLLVLFFAGMLLISFVLIAWLSRPSPQEKRAQKRLTALVLRSGERDSIAEAAEDLLKQKIGAGSVARLDDFLDRFDFYLKLEKLIQQAHRNTTPGRVIMQSAGLAAAAALLAHFLYPVLGVEIAAPFAAAALPSLLLVFLRGRRLKQFNDALPDSIDLMSRALKAGHSVASAIEVVAEQGHEPVASEFGEVFRAQNFGLPFRDALAQLAERVPSRDLHFLVTAMMVQKETGGNLTEILDRTTHVIRERLRILGEVRTKTAQGRLTGTILAALPIILGVMLNFLNPGYAKPLFHDPLGKKMLYIGAGLIALGGFIISRIVKIEV